MIRHVTPDDIPRILSVFDKARGFMLRSGNPFQWINGYPSEDVIRNDIENGDFYVEELDGRIRGCFAFIIGEEPTYRSIVGSWPDDSLYGTIHRLASDGTAKGFADRCISFCMGLIPNLRADTHRDNHLMRKALRRNGFQYCGIIRVANGSERLAYSLHPDSQS